MGEREGRRMKEMGKVNRGRSGKVRREERGEERGAGTKGENEVRRQRMEREKRESDLRACTGNRRAEEHQGSTSNKEDDSVEMMTDARKGEGEGQGDACVFASSARRFFPP